MKIKNKNKVANMTSKIPNNLYSNDTSLYPQSSPLLNLPPEILCHILKKAISTPADAADLSLVCHHFYNIMNSRPIWQEIALQKGHNQGYLI